MKWILVKDKTWDTVLGVKPDPVTDIWTNLNNNAMSRLMLSVEEDQLVHVRHLEVAADVWSTFQRLYERTTLSSKVFLRRKFWTLRFDTGTMQQHIIRVQELASQLKTAGIKLEPGDEIAGLLASMPDSYDGLVTALESRDEDTLTFELVSGKLLDEYQRRTENGATGQNVDSAMNSVASFQPQKIQQQQNARQQQPQRFANKNGNKKNKETRTCYHCGKPGHLKSDCRKLKSEKASTEHKGSKANVLNSDQSKKGEQFSFVMREGAHKATNISANWLVDSGASSHMTNNKEFFTELKSTTQRIDLAGEGHTVPATGIGSGIIKCQLSDGSSTEVRLRDVLYVPQLDGGLLSVSKMRQYGFKVTFDEDGCTIRSRDGKIAAQAAEKNNLFALVCAPSNNEGSHRSYRASAELWHRRLGHRDSEAIKKLYSKKMATGIELKAGDHHDSTICETCIKGKLSKMHYGSSTSRATRPLDLVHSDVCGPMQNVTPSGNRYCITLIDDYSRFTMVRLVQNKTEVTQVIKDYVTLTENQFGRRIKVLRTDNGTEYVNRELSKYLSDKGIVHQTSVAYTPEQNGRAERKNRYLVEMARCLLLDAGLPHRFWGEAIRTASYLQNRLPTNNTNKTPYELWNGKPPDISHLRVIGSKVYSHVPDAKRTKWDDKAKEGVLIGYDTNTKGYRILNPNTGMVWIAQSVRIIEPVTEVTRDTTLEEVNPVEVEEEWDLSSDEAEDSISDEEPNVVSTPTTIPQPVQQEEGINDGRRRGRPPGVRKMPQLEPIAPLPEGEQQMPSLQPENRRSTRINRGVLPSRYCNRAETERVAEPATWDEMMLLPKRERRQWQEAAKQEMAMLEKYKVFELADLPAGKRVISSKWVFKAKLDAEGNIHTHKARLVARGFSQRYGEEYDETFAPVVKHETVRILLAYAAARRQHVRHLDVKSAYLNGELSEDLYMEQPEGFEVPGAEEKVLRLRKSIYGLKQAARAWNNAAKATLNQAGFQQSRADPCLFTSKEQGGALIHVLLYVDDLLVIGKNAEITRKIGEQLNQYFEMTDLGDVKHYLGIQVERKEDGSFLIHQQTKIHHMLKEHGMLEAKPVATPMETGFLSNNVDSSRLPNNKQYRQAVGSLLYFSTVSRPDIALSVGILCRQVERPTESDWNTVKRVMRYLVSTINQKLLLPAGGDLVLKGFIDADWAGDRKDRKSTSGFLFQLGDTTVSWSSKKQTTVALSSTEAEYIAVSHACRELQWLRQLLADLQVPAKGATVLFEDNQGCIKMVNSDRCSARTKHIDVCHHYLRDLREEGIIRMEYCPTNEMTADILTKPLAREPFGRLRSTLGLVED